MILTINHLAGVLGYSKNELLEIANNKELYYYEYSKIKYDENNKPKIKNNVIQKRHYKPSKDKLRDIQNTLQQQVFSKIKLLPCIKGGVKGSGSIENAKIHKGKKYRFQTDLTNFFPSVTPEMVYKGLRSKNFSKSVAKIICQLTTCPTRDSFKGSCLPQGAPTSPTLANIVFERADSKIMELINNREINYTRWIDDLTFSSNTSLPITLQLDIIAVVSKSGLKISKKKTTYRINTSTITGVDVSMSTMKVTEKFRNKDESNLNDLQKKGRIAYKQQIYKIDKAKKSG